jgi:antitoxin component YwqK of YwqJK toxin-antitoxin module
MDSRKDGLNGMRYFSNVIYSNLFGGFLSEFVNYPYQNYGYEEEYMPNNGADENSPKRIAGKMLNGKPEGLWKVFDRKGKVLWEIPFTNGMVNGTVIQNETIYPMSAQDREMAMYEGGYAEGSFPKKETHYLSYTTEYKNGLKNGPFEERTANGVLSIGGSFLNGKKDGTWEFYEYQGILEKRISYKADSLDGAYLVFTLNGDTLTSGNYANGKKQGFWCWNTAEKRMEMNGFFHEDFARFLFLHKIHVQAL